MAAFVTGGCGCIGYHLVKALVSSNDYESVHVMSRNPTSNLVDKVLYHVGDVRSSNRIKELLDQIRPIVIFHVASPRAINNTGNLQSFLSANVEGTRNLLDYAISSVYVKAFVFTSSSSIYQGHTFNFTTEDAPKNTLGSRADPYSTSKAIADQLVLDTNGKGGIKTTCLRVSSAYGELDEQMIKGAVEGMDRWRNQVGDNTNLCDPASVENIAILHLAAAKALLEDTPAPDSLRVDGEAFNVTDGQPLPFWDFVRMIWQAGGVIIRPEEIKVIPGWFMLALAGFMEWVYWIFTLGRARPDQLQRHRVLYLISPRTFSIEKAKERLGYKPVHNREKHIKAGVDWVLGQKASKKQ